MINISVNDEPDSSWNNRLISSGYGTKNQSIQEGKSAQNNNKTPQFITFTNESNEIIGQLLVSLSGRFTKKNLSQKLIGKVLKLKSVVCTWEYGPIVFEPSYSKSIYKKLGEYLSSKNYVVSGWQHPLQTDGVSVLEQKFQLIPWSTFMIDLSPSVEILFQNIEKKSGQKNIKRSQERGVTIEEIDEHNLIDFLNLRNEMRKKQGVPSRSVDDFLFWWKLMKPLGLSGFLTRKNNKTIGGLLFSYMNNQIVEIAVARSEFDTKEKLYSQDLIKWKIIEWGHNHGIKYFNLAGFNPNPKTDKERGIHSYKKKWGGKEIPYYHFLKINKKGSYKIMRALLKIDWMIREKRKPR